MTAKEVILKPRISEKAHEQAGALNVYVFEVEGQASKALVSRAVQEQFSVGVKSVNITNIKGKAKRTVRKGARPVAGRQAAIRKAYVTLNEGDKLPFFEAIEEEEKKQTERQEKLAAAASKRAAKEAKKSARSKGDEGEK